MRRGLLVLLATALFSCGSGGGSPEPSIPPPVVYRTDLLYGYYGQMADGAQLAETIDHVNLVMASRWWGPAQQMADVIAATNAGIPVMLDMPENSEQEVRQRLGEFKTAGVAHNIIAIYRYDELDINGPSATVVQEANATLRRVAAEYGMYPKLATVYSVRAVGVWPAIGTWDWVGVDEYDAGARIFTNGTYDSLKQNLRADQKIILIPGGCDKWRTDPTQFMNKAQQDKQVALLLPFVWRDNADPANGAFAGIRSNGMAPVYRAVGLKVKVPG